MKPVTEKNDIRQLIRSPLALIGAGVFVALLIAGGFFVMTRKKKKAAAMRVSAALDAAEKAEETAGKKALPQPDKPGIANSGPDMPALPSAATELERLRDNIRETVSRDPAFAAGVLRSWITQSEAS